MYFKIVSKHKVFATELYVGKQSTNCTTRVLKKETLFESRTLNILSLKPESFATDVPTCSFYL